MNINRSLSHGGFYLHFSNYWPRSSFLFLRSSFYTLIIQVGFLSFSPRYIFRSLIHLEFGLFIFLLICKSFYNLSTNTFTVICFTKISHSEVCIFTLLMVFFDEQKFLISCSQINLLRLALFVSIFSHLKVIKISPLFCLKNCIGWLFIFKSLIPMKLICVVWGICTFLYTWYITCTWSSTCSGSIYLFFIFFAIDLKCRFCHKSHFHIRVHLFMNSIFCSISQFVYNCPIPCYLNYYNQVNLKKFKKFYWCIIDE